MAFRTRFAPSPTGPLHLGHAYSALLAFDMAMAAGGDFLLRIEDIDQSRSREKWVEQILDDLRWLGITCHTQIIRQSDITQTYKNHLSELWKWGLLYPCTCTRRDIATAASAPQEGAPTHGPDGVIYPGTCREKWHDMPKDQAMSDGPALRLDLRKCLKFIPEHIEFIETGVHAGSIAVATESLLSTIGDPVLSRPGMGTSYHLSVVVDDAAKDITHVIRGEDLLEATPLHVVLQHIMGFQTPIYHHHKLIRDGAGKRLAKRDDARAISKYRSEGATPRDIRQMVGLPTRS